MSTVETVYLFFYLLSCGGALMLAFHCLRKRREVGALQYGGVAVSQAVWIFGALMEFLSQDLQVKLFWDLLQYAGAAGWMIFLWFFALGISGLRPSRPRLASALVILPALGALLFVVTDSWHGLARREPRLIPWEGDGLLNYGFTAVTLTFSLYAYTVILSSLALLMRKYLRMHRLYRGQVGFIVLGNVIPVLGAVLTMTLLRDFAMRDLSPFTFTACNLLAAWGLIRYRLFAIIPLARDLLIDVMDDAVVVLDMDHHVIDFNEAARDVCVTNGSITIGSSFERMCGDADGAINVNDIEGNTIRDVVLSTHKGVRYFELKTWALAPEEGLPSGHLLMFRDISDRKKIELELRKSRDLLITRLDRAQATREKLEEMAMRDALTGLYNRYFLDEVFARELQRAERASDMVGCVLLDIDFFKVVNDEYGHQTGDLILQGVGDLMRECTRKSDITCRYGGEEFLVILPGAGDEIVLERAEQIRERFAAMRILSEGRVITATLSAGVSMFPRHGSDSAALIRTADKALYRAKRAGRNMVMMADLADSFIETP